MAVFVVFVLQESPKIFQFFPYLYLTEETYDVEDADLPPREMYAMADKSQKEQERFEKWYQEQLDKGARFTMREELLRYTQVMENLKMKACHIVF